MAAAGQRQQLGTVLLSVITLALATACAAQGDSHTLAVVGSGVAQNWLGDLSLPWALRLRDRIVGRAERKSDDLCSLLVRAFPRAVSMVYQTWTAQTAGDAAAEVSSVAIGQFFTELGIQGPEVIPALLHEVAPERLVLEGVAVVTGAQLRDELAVDLRQLCIASLPEAEPQLVDQVCEFILLNLPDQLAHYYQDELKGDSRAQWAVLTVREQVVLARLEAIQHGGRVQSGQIAELLSLTAEVRDRLAAWDSALRLGQLPTQDRWAHDFKVTLDPMRTLEQAYLGRLWATELRDTELYITLSGSASHTQPLPQVRTVNKRAVMRTLLERFPPAGADGNDPPRFYDDIVAAVNDHPRAVILGEPGAGKTTLLLKVAADTVMRAQSDAEAPLPLLARLSDWTDAAVPLEELLARTLGVKFRLSGEAGRVAARPW